MTVGANLDEEKNCKSKLIKNDNINSDKFALLMLDITKKDTLPKYLTIDNCIIEEIDISEIYNATYNTIKEKYPEKLKKLIEEKTEGSCKKIAIKIPIKIRIVDSEIKGNIKFYYYKELKNEMMEIKTIFEEGLEINNTVFNGRVSFWECKFKKDVIIEHSFFNNIVDFGNTRFEECLTLYDTIFKNIVDFSSITAKYLKIEKAIFESITRFLYISCNLVIITDTIFNNLMFFSVNNNKQNYLFMIKTVFNNEFSKIIHTSLSKMSFLLTDVEYLTIIAKAEKILDNYLLELINKKIKIGRDEKKVDEIIKEIKKISNNKDEQHGENQLLEKLINQIRRDNFIYFSDDDFYNNFIKILHEILPYLEKKTVLKEYRSIRKSFEKKRTYIEASELFIYEMALLKKGFDKEIEQIKQNSRILKNNLLKYFILLSEKCIFRAYHFLSDYGESIFKLSIYSVLFILLFPAIALYLNYFDFSKVSQFYFKSASETLRAFFQLGIKDNDSLMYNYEWIIRIISLILLGNIFIAIKRRLERK